MNDRTFSKKIRHHHHFPAEAGMGQGAIRLRPADQQLKSAKSAVLQCRWGGGGNMLDATAWTFFCLKGLTTSVVGDIEFNMIKSMGVAAIDLEIKTPSGGL